MLPVLVSHDVPCKLELAMNLILYDGPSTLNFLPTPPGADPGIIKGGGPAEFTSKKKGGGGGSNHLLGSNLYCNKQNLLKKGGSGPPGHPPGSAPESPCMA